MLLGLPDRKLLTKFQLLSALSNILLLMPEECKGGNEQKMQWRNVWPSNTECIWSLPILPKPSLLFEFTTTPYHVSMWSVDESFHRTV